MSFSHFALNLFYSKDMLERIDRLRDTDGLPRVKSSTPNDFFDALEAESDQLCTFRGELYLELHQGTFTTQGEVQQNTCDKQMEHSKLCINRPVY